MNQRLERVPDRRLPAAYFIFAHACLLAALGVSAYDPASLAGFFYHPRMLAVVHLVTLGWITGSILGALHFVLPMAMRSPLPVRLADRWAFWFFVVGVLGMVSHFWIDTPGGMAWSAGLVVAALIRVGWRVVTALATAPVPIEHRLPFVLGFANMLLAGLLGLLIGVDKTTPILDGYVLDHVAAHAHLAALGWATFLVMGSAYRLLPMLLPAAVPRGSGPLTATILCELGVLSLSAGLYLGSPLALIGALLYIGGVGTFLLQVRWMKANPKPPPRQLRRPDFGVRHILAAFVYLVITGLIGGVLLLRPESAHKVALLTAYGVCGLLGFLAQMVVGVSVRFLPLYAWMRDFSASDFVEVPVSPHDRTWPALHRLTFWTWNLGTPLLALGLAGARTGSIRIAGVALGAAVMSSLTQLLLLLRRRQSE